MHKVDIEQGSYEWHCKRQGNVTGTTLKSALGTKKVQDTLMFKMLAERMTEPHIEDIGSKAVQRGKEIEPIARAKVIKETGLNFVETGMLDSDEFERFLISPDAIYEENGVVVGGLEIKCPDSKKHLEYVIGNDVPKEYFHQVIAPFLISDDIDWWIFASFDDRNYELPLFMTKVYREDLPEIEEWKKKLNEFLERVAAQHAAMTF